MAFFDFGWKRKGGKAPSASAQRPTGTTPQTAAPGEPGGGKGRRGAALGAQSREPGPDKAGTRIAAQPAVEVSEVSLDDEAFSSTFGPPSSQFPDSTLQPATAEQDPWRLIRRLD